MDWLREEITELQLASNIPLLSALLLGLLGALSPLPVIIFAVVASLAAIKVSDSLKKARFWGLLLQRGAALAFIGFGIREIFYYWNV